MAETTTTTFRFPALFQGLLDRVAAATSTSRTEVVQRSVELTAKLLNEASRAQYADLDELRAHYGTDGRIVLGAFQNEHGFPEARLLINGEPVEDVIAYVRVDEAAGEAHLFLEVLRPQGRNASYAKIGSEVLFVVQPRMPVGTLPWPPRPHLAIQILLGELEQDAKAAENTVELIEL